MLYGSQWLTQPHPESNLVTGTIQSNQGCYLFRLPQVVIFQPFIPLIIFCFPPVDKVYTAQLCQ
jgi:hypothetical protein